ncbi:transposase [Microbispora bryophytorum]|uniref:transposase n=1 Tax=Microbispora bryophytorum TaxID=1460882 RepID=UPI00295F3F47|nr:transposase [Microbispora camponoti]
MTAVAVGADVLSPSKALILASVPRGMRRTPDQQTFLRALREDPDVLALRYDGYGNLLRVAQVIAWATAWTTMCSRPTIAGICERTGLSKATVKRWIRWLREHGWLGVVEEGTTVRFRKGTSAGLQDDGLGNRAAVWVLCIRRDITPVPARRISRWGTILYQSRTGCQWDFMPHDLPPRSAVYYYFAKWRDDGTDQTIHDLLRWQAREKRGRLADPSLAVLDTQSVHAAAGVPPPRREKTQVNGCPDESAAWLWMCWAWLWRWWSWPPRHMRTPSESSC